MAIRRSLAASLIGRYLGLTVSVVTSVVISRLLTPAEIGLFGIAFAAVAITAGIRQFGAIDYLVQRTELDRRDMGRGFALTMGLALILAGLIWLAKGWVAAFYGEPRLSFLLELLTVNLVLSPFGIAAIAALQREYAFATLETIGLCAGIAGAATAVVLVLRGQGPASLAYGQIVTVAVHTSALAVVRPRAVFCAPVFSGLGTMFRFGAYRSLTVLVGNLGLHSVPLVLGRSLGVVPVGLYDRANGISGRLADITGSIQRVVFVALSQAKADPARLSAFVLLSVGNLTAVMWPAFALLAVVAEPVIVLLFGEPWRPSAPILSILCVAGFVWLSATVPFELLTAQGRALRQLSIESFSAAVRLALTIALATYGLAAAVSGTVVSAAVNAAILWCVTWPQVGLSLKDLLQVLARSACLALATVAVPVLLIVTGTAQHIGPLATLLLSGVTGFVGWFIAAMLLRHTIYGELRSALLRAWEIVTRRQLAADRTDSRGEPVD